MLVITVAASLLALVSDNVGGPSWAPELTSNIIDMLSGMLGMILFIPAVSLTWRRLHDAGFAGPWALLAIIPLGGLAVLIMVCLRSRPELMNQQWEDPETLNPAGGISSAPLSTYLIIVQSALLVITAITFTAGMNNAYNAYRSDGTALNNVEGTWNYMTQAGVFGGLFMVFCVTYLFYSSAQMNKTGSALALLRALLLIGALTLVVVAVLALFLVAL
jgi:uncharacterized membrane protein YhaH (DUF805 family)